MGRGTKKFENHWITS